jgi:hypothetical protein
MAAASAERTQPAEESSRSFRAALHSRCLLGTEVAITQRGPGVCRRALAMIKGKVGLPYAWAQG